MGFVLFLYFWGDEILRVPTWPCILYEAEVNLELLIFLLLPPVGQRLQVCTGTSSLCSAGDGSQSLRRAKQTHAEQSATSPALGRES